MRSSTPTVAAALAALPLLFAGCGADRTEPPYNVILICLDTVRADYLGCYGYETWPSTPTLDDLASRSTVFKDTSATACWTKPSVPSFLTGTYPIEHGVYRGSSKDEAGTLSDALPESALTLAEVFKERGYATAAFVKNAQLRAGLGFEQGFDVYQDEAGDAREIRWRASDWLDQREPDRPYFLYLHYLDAHWPYPVPDEYAQMFAGEGAEFFRNKDWRAARDAINDGELILDDNQRQALLALYAGSIRYIDDQLELFFNKLDKAGRDRDTIVCVVSDHGEEFLEHGRIGHGHGLYENLLQVPWILYVPGRGAGEVEAPCSLVDLFPTLLSAAGIKSLPNSHGVDRLAEPDVQRPVFAEHLEKRAYQHTWREGDAKLVRRAVHASPSPPAEVQGTLSRVLPMTRWEAKFERVPGVGLRAIRLRPRTEAVEDPTEIKGVIEAVSEGTLVLDGVRVALAEDTETYGALLDENGEVRELRPGMMVKARGLMDAGTLAAKKVKLYPTDDELEHEIRGAVNEVETQRLRIGGIWIATDAATEVDAEAPKKLPMSRELVAEYLALEAPGDYAVETRVFDLARDPAEQAALSDERAPHAALERLAAFGRYILSGRIWAQGDRVELTEEQLAALKAIGYAE